MFALLKIAGIYESLKLFADLRDPAVVEIPKIKG